MTVDDTRAPVDRDGPVIRRSIGAPTEREGGPVMRRIIGAGPITKSDDNIEILLCISMVVLVFFIGVTTGRNLEKHNQIEDLEAMR